VLVGLGVVLVVLSFFSTTEWASGTARRTAERLREDAAAPRFEPQRVPVA
jgi:hypothetical protein